MSILTSAHDLALLAAIHAKSAAGVMSALRAGADPNTRDVDRIPAISLAASIGNPQITRTLLEFSPDITATDKYGNSPLHRAVAITPTQFAAFFPNDIFNPAIDRPQSCFDARKCVAMLLAAGACVDAANNSQATPLHLSVGGPITITRVLLAANANVDAAMDDGTTALHLAGANGRTGHVKALLAANANPRLLDKTGREPFVRAARTGRLPAMCLLAQASRNAGMDDAQAMHQLREIIVPGAGPASSPLMCRVLSQSTLPQDMADKLLLAAAVNRQLVKSRSSKRFKWIPIAQAALSHFKEANAPQNEALARCVLLLFIRAMSTMKPYQPSLTSGFIDMPVWVNDCRKVWPDLSGDDLKLLTRPANLLLNLDTILYDHLDLGSQKAQRLLCAAARSLGGAARRSKTGVKPPAAPDAGRQPVVSRSPLPSTDKLPPTVIDAIHLITAIDEIQSPGRIRPLRQISFSALADGQVPTDPDTISLLRSILANDAGQEMLASLDCALLSARPRVVSISAAHGRQRG